MANRPKWSDLPTDLLTNISNRLTRCIDILRFRAVCSSWRSSIPPFKHSPPLPLTLPFPIVPNPGISPNRRGFFTLNAVTVYHFQPLHSPKGWLLKVGDYGNDQLRFLHPLSTLTLTRLPESFPKVLNLLDFRISELYSSYDLRYVDRCNSYAFFSIRDHVALIVEKAVLFDSGDGFGVLVMHDGGKLGFLKLGDEKWTPVIRPSPYPCHDILNFRGKMYVVDETGQCYVVDSSLKLIQVACSCWLGGLRRHLVESAGDLFLVTKCLSSGEDPVLDIRLRVEHVSKLNEEEHTWVAVRNLGDRVFFVGDDCSYSVSALDFPGLHGNSIYFVEQFSLSMQEWFNSHFNAPRKYWDVKLCVFNFEDNSVGRLKFYPGYGDIFWQPQVSSGKNDSYFNDECD